ncbi:uncharacterized protein LOC118803949 isoform X2 [Colossoma macropomum]|uniref:uncharacterized protein LOC118803949 isoform X2 n=1 Tax=Colossoma macropomum TaxID=42526 RepID=UPI0018650F19|nr:uncharacterized protein LOC118803949 isoform X2 [Colossoma macropomum]
MEDPVHFFKCKEDSSCRPRSQHRNAAESSLRLFHHRIWSTSSDRQPGQMETLSSYRLIQPEACWSSCGRGSCSCSVYARDRVGNTWRRRTWVFGILESRGDSRRPVLRLVKRRNKQTLLPIIKQHVRPQSVIISDEWRAYSTLSQVGYVHHTVNHSVNFVDLVTGNHTQHIERAWNTYKHEVWRLRGNRNEKALKDQLLFIEWTYWLGRKHRKGVLGRLLKDIRVE